MYLGVVRIKTIQNNNFVFDRALGKGAYVIAGHTGYSFNNDYESQNFNATEFRFSNRDYVTLVYDPVSSKVNFFNESKKLQAVLNIKKDENDPLHFCAVIFHKGTELEIITEDGI